MARVTPGRWLSAATAVALLILGGIAVRAVAQGAAKTDPSKLDASASELIAQGACHCGCGRVLPGHRDGSGCFGCSVGKAEVTFIHESLAAGVAPREILLALLRPLLIEVFADYTDPALPEVWERVKRIAARHNQHRVVLRARANAPPALAAVAALECARGRGRFSELQRRLIDHRGPWDLSQLLRHGMAAGLDEEELRSCLRKIDVQAQVRKDREQMRNREIEKLPGVAVARRRISAGDDAALNEAIQRALRAGGL